MKLVILQTVAFEKPVLGTLPADVIADMIEADVTVCVYQSAVGEARAEAVALPGQSDQGIQVVVHDVV